jgi:micrococcal nuclease
MACPWGKCGFAQESSEDPAIQGQPEQPQGPLLPKVRGDFRDLRMTVNKMRVSDVIDGVTLVLDNKTKVRLVGVWVPWESENDPGETVKKAATLLKKVAQGRFVRLYQTKDEEAGRENRLGQQLAQVERDDGLWLQGVLLYAGLATVMTSENNPESAARMYAIEADARKRKAGLWADARWNVLEPDKAKAYANEYRIVEGRVFSTAMRNNVFYINFSRDWKTDFTVAVPSDKRLAFSRQGVNLMGLNGKTIRVRGWVRNYNGPMIEISHPQQIEVIE